VSWAFRLTLAASHTRPAEILLKLSMLTFSRKSI
jgi:hypothetical protein